MALNNTNTDILVAGAFAAFTVDFLIYPLDTIKTRIQSPDYKRLYTTNFQINRSLFRGLYQGIGSIILATVPSSGAFFTTYESVKVLLPRLSPFDIPTPLLHSLSSSVAELVSCLILTPAEVLKQNAQVVSSSSQSNSPFATQATRKAFDKFKANPKQLWTGYTALAARNLPFTGLHFPLFEALRDRIYRHRERKGQRSNSLLETGTVTALSAGTAGSLAAVITTPIDVVKTRVMLSAADNNPSKASPPHQIKKPTNHHPRSKKGGWAVGREVLHTEGVKGLFRGGVLRGTWTAVGSGLYLGSYESGRRWLEGKRTEKEGRAV